MGKDDRLIKIAFFNTKLNVLLEKEYETFPIYKSKGLMAHLINRKHYAAVKYIDNLPDIIRQPDFIGIHNDSIELVKCYKDNIFICVKLDSSRTKYYVVTMFDIKQSKIESYVRSGRLIKVDAKK